MINRRKNIVEAGVTIETARDPCQRRFQARIMFEITGQGKLEGVTFQVIIDSEEARFSEELHPVDTIF